MYLQCDTIHSECLSRIQCDTKGFDEIHAALQSDVKDTKQCHTEGYYGIQSIAITCVTMQCDTALFISLQYDTI